MGVIVNKEEYKKMEVLQQVEYINKQLEQSSLNKVAKELGIDESTIRSKFTNNGFKRERTGRKLFVAITDTETTPTTTTNNTTETTTTTRATKKATEQIQDSKQIKVLEDRVGSLEKELEGIKAILNTITTENTKNTNTITTDNIKIKKYKGADSSRSYRVNNKVLEQWKAFCKAHSEHKVGDLLANAMVEYMNKFK